MFLSRISCKFTCLSRIKPHTFTIAAHSFGSVNFPPLQALKKVPFDYIRVNKAPSYLSSGDNEPLVYENYDLSKPVLKFENCRNIENAGEIVQKLISLKYASKREKQASVLQEFRKRVRRHPMDTTSLEARIARYTVMIRHQLTDVEGLKKDGKRITLITTCIDRRKKLLKFLRRADANRFGWILETLNITYTPPPMFWHWTTRKGTLRNLTREHCEKLRKQKIDAYRAKLKSLQAEFLEEKEKLLEWIKQQEEELQLTPTEIKFMEQQMLPFKIPVFPKYLSYKKPVVEHMTVVPEN